MRVLALLFLAATFFLSASSATATCYANGKCDTPSEALTNIYADRDARMAQCAIDWAGGNLCHHQQHCELLISDKRAPAVVYSRYQSQDGYVLLCPGDPPGQHAGYLGWRWWVGDTIWDRYPGADPGQNLGCPGDKCQNFYGNPVNVGIGNKFQRETDFIDPKGRLTFERFYNSAVEAGETVMGIGWSHTFSRRVRKVVGDTTRFDMVRPDGRTFRFVESGGAWVAPVNVRDKLNMVLSGGSPAGWQYVVRADNSIENYNLDGTLSSIDYTDGSRVNLTWVDHDSYIHTPNRLSEVIDRSGRKLTFAYDSAGYLSSLTDPAGKVYGYTHSDSTPATMPNPNNGFLVSVDYPGTGDRTYGYTGSQLSSIIDENGDPYAVWYYDSNGRATASAHDLSADAYDFAYSTSSTGQALTTITHPNNATTVLEFQVKAGGTIELVDADSRCPGCGDLAAERTYIGSTSSGAGDVDVVTDFNNVDTDINYDSGGLGLVTEVIESANVQSTRRTTQTAWDTTTLAPRIVPTERRIYDSSSSTLPGTIEGKTTYTYNSRGQVLTTTQVDGSVSRTTTYDYCETGSESCPLDGLLQSINGPRDDSADVLDKTEYSYYAGSHSSCSSAPTTCPYRLGDLYEVTNALGHVTRYTVYDGAGRVLSLTQHANDSANAVITDFTYSDRGWLTARKVRGTNSSSETDDLITTVEYDDVGQVTRVVQPNGSDAEFVYDVAHRLTSVVDALGNHVDYTLDAFGNRVQEDTKNSAHSVKRGLTRTYSVDNEVATQSGDRSASSGDEFGSAYTYDAMGRLDVSTDPLGRDHDNDYDALGRLVQTEDFAGVAGSSSTMAVTNFEYDARDNLVVVSDPKGLDTTYTYSDFGDLTQLVSPDTGTTTYGYDPAGNRVAQTDARGIDTDYSYDALGRLVSIEPEDTNSTDESVTFVYDNYDSDCTATEDRFSKGRLALMDDESGSTRYCYDRFGRLTKKAQTVENIPLTAGGTGSVSRTLTITELDKAGNVMKMTYPSGATVEYTRNAKGQITGVSGKPSSGASTVTLLSSVGYVPFGPRTGWTFGNGRVMTYAWDLNYDIDLIGDSVSSDGLYENYTLDDAGNVTAINERVGTATRTYEYDALDRLTAHKNGSTTVEGFTYDATGNRLSKTVSGTATSYSYPSTSHWLSSTATAGVTTNRSYDNNGNTTEIGTAYDFAYNDRNRLSGVTAPSSNTRTHVYNGKGERVGKWYNTPASNLVFFYDEAGHLLGEYNQTGARVAEYVWMDDTLVAIYKNHDTSTYQYIETDYLGTPRAVVNPTSNSVVWWRWDVTPRAFGDHEVDNNPDGNALVYNLPLRYPGQYFDGFAWINYNYSRDYEATTGRYLESDPMGLYSNIGAFQNANSHPRDPASIVASSINPSTYAYVRSRPLNATDARGLFDDPSGPGDGQPVPPGNCFLIWQIPLAMIENPFIRTLPPMWVMYCVYNCVPVCPAPPESTFAKVVLRWDGPFCPPRAAQP